jgi:hypothetical protein
MQAADLLRQFPPFARPEAVEGMVIGDDLDSLLSAMYLQARFGWPVVGVYCRYTFLWHVPDEATFRRKVAEGRYVGIDLDVFHPTLPSVGHHILVGEGRLAEGPHRAPSLNPNTLRGLSVQAGFQEKYPLATIHFLWWLFGENPMLPKTMRLMWLADSAWINAQRYRPNVTDWVTQYLRVPAFLDHLLAVQTVHFEQVMAEKTLAALAPNPLCRPNGYSVYKSLHLGLNGYQCQWADPVAQNADLQDLCARLADLSGWAVLRFPTQFAGVLTGERHQIDVREVPAKPADFDIWLQYRGVFSYAFVFRHALNYTVLAL